MTEEFFVDLPEGDLITPSELVRAIVDALFPVKKNGLTGLQCVWGKKKEISATSYDFNHDYTGNDPTEQFVAKSLVRSSDVKFGDRNGREINNAKPSRLILRFRLGRSETELLLKVIARAPDLKHPVSEETSKQFHKILHEYPEWKDFSLIFFDESMAENEFQKLYQKHMEALTSAVSDRYVSCCNIERLPMPRVGVGSLIPRKQAIEYLKLIGLGVCDVKEKNNTFKLIKQAQEIDWANSQYVSEKLRALCVAADMWRQMPFDENRTKEDYRRFHEGSVVPMLRRPTFADRRELQKRAAEYIRPLYARRKRHDTDELQEEYISSMSPELVALLLASRLWQGWNRKGNTATPSKENVKDAIRQFLPLGFNATDSFISDASKLLQPQDADTGRERQATAKAKKARKPA